MLDKRKEHLPNSGVSLCCDVAEVIEASQSEHFDVVLCMSTLHHVERWRELLSALFSIGSRVVLEYPTPADTECKHRERLLEQYKFLERMEHRVLGYTDSHAGRPEVRKLTLHESQEAEVNNAAFYYHRRVGRAKKVRRHRISSNSRAKVLNKDDGRVSTWVHGISLWSAVNMGLVHPSRERIADQLESMETPQHGDLKPWNIVLDGERLHIIDRGEKYRSDPGESIAAMVSWLRTGSEMS
jgi:hypothetical protein